MIEITNIFNDSKRKHYKWKPFNMSKLLTVFSTSSNQGGSVIRYILTNSKLSKEFQIHSITCDTKKPALQDLVKQGVNIVLIS